MLAQLKSINEGGSVADSDFTHAKVLALIDCFAR